MIATRIARHVPRLLALLALALVARPALADCRCATSTRAPWCSSDGRPIQYASARGTQLSVDLGAYGGSNSYLCGQYADQTVWVVGNASGGTRGVTVASTSPAPSGDKHGFEVNQAFSVNGIDGRGNGDTRGAYVRPPALPQTYAGAQLPASFVKGVSRNVAVESNGTCDPAGIDNRSCIQYVDVITFVAQVPDSDGDGSTADEFRPAFHGAASAKPGPYRTDMMQAALASWPNLSPSAPGSKPDLADCEKSQRHPILEFQQLNYSDSDTPLDSAIGPFGNKSYQGGFALNTVACALRTLLADAAVAQESPTRSVGRQLLINVVQRGIDMYGAFRTGRRWRPEIGGWGGHWQGQKPYALMAGHLLGEAGIRRFARSESGATFWEDGQAYRGSDGRTYYGFRSGGPCDDFSGDNTVSSNKTIQVYCAPKPPAGPWDANCIDIQGQAYPLQHFNIATGMATLVLALGAQSTWNDDVYLEWARALGTGTRGPGYSAAKPYKLYCGPSNKNGLSNWPQDAFYNGYYRCPFCERMFDVFGANLPIGGGGGGGGSEPPPPTPEPLPAPVQLPD
jgi:hypothetical protein